MTPANANLKELEGMIAEANKINTEIGQKMKETEENAILIYIKEGKQYGISTREEAEIVEAFIFALYES